MVPLPRGQTPPEEPLQPEEGAPSREQQVVPPHPRPPTRRPTRRRNKRTRTDSERIRKRLAAPARLIPATGPRRPAGRKTTATARMGREEVVLQTQTV